MTDQTVSDPVYAEALARFAASLEEARTLGLKEPTAVALATASAAGLPSVRIVLLRGWDARGFHFFTNSLSRKGIELVENPSAALCFYWDSLERQIRIEGAVEVVSADESDAYWQGRHRESRIGAWASQQSQPLDKRQTLEERVAQFETRYPGDDVPRPEFWHGYRVIPQRIEFWQGRPARLHERDLYERIGTTWTRQLLYP